MIIAAAAAPAISFEVIIGHAFYLPFFSVFLQPKGTF